MIHDIDHPGRTNVYHVATKDPLAILYNDKSVLENHHVAFTYLLLDRPDCNIYSGMPPDVKQRIREIVILMVLSTDNAKHFAELGQLKQRMQDKGFPERDRPADKQLILKNILHSCDISNPTKDLGVAVEWTVLVLEEFFAQGDREKDHQIPVSMFMDRQTTNLGTCQVGFMNALVAPLYTALELIFPALRIATGNLSKTREFWAAHVDLFAERLAINDPYPLKDVPGLLEAYRASVAIRPMDEDIPLERRPSRDTTSMIPSRKTRIAPASE
jgi:hypothetical protein